MTDYDPAEVAIKPAATVMLVDDRPDMKVLMMRRDANTVFAGGMWVFPGGSVDSSDDHDHFQSISEHRTDVEASQLMGLESGGLSYYIAAIRECFEEAGVLLARFKGADQAVSLTDAMHTRKFEAYRDHVNDRTLDFLDFVQAENLVMDAGEMHYIAHWITPLGPPRRFNARFFIARMPRDQEPIHDNRETVHAEWFSPDEILQKFESEEMILMTPTLRMIRSLSLFKTTDEVIQAAAANQSDERVRVDAVTNELLLPGQDGYERGSLEIESGWIRLRPLTRQHEFENPLEGEK
jgi:8-oxo-dGTP pyrophosphatase MutT (NUDIX family)